MELSLLPPILLALAEQRSLDAVLSTIVETVAGQPDGIKAPDTIRFAVRSEARFQVGPETEHHRHSQTLGSPVRDASRLANSAAGNGGQCATALLASAATAGV